MKARTKFGVAAASVALVVGGMGAVAVPAGANAAERTLYACYNGGGAPMQFTKNTSPSKCDGGIYRIQRGGKTVAMVDLRHTKSWSDLVARFDRAHKSVNQYCVNYPTDCTIYATIGAALLAPILAANS
ncbi:hypothetical protein NYQ35_01435 [Curtobacterium flaccumfaciens pv. flaccumfaciens]|jgi:hypothetical protein|uniref:hypothetical protein n=1 Tax=Curtobacterium flaccumfaciens TaxID=2035 RepID=UPI00217F1FAB|nr:hypothetical protein [Curtobacterium flaccumfaciens]MCS6567452.1 hypothetical protein [Curtobacterium flaccumfaciens pv. flaccumfaciens]MCS6585534.1 hypothetical protein [Curtobacterium flaccumfaciens pv. flaccumfaciens]